MSSFKEKLSKSGQSVLDARAQNLYELAKIEEDRFVQDCKLKVLRIQEKSTNTMTWLLNQETL